MLNHMNEAIELKKYSMHLHLLKNGASRPKIVGNRLSVEVRNIISARRNKNINAQKKKKFRTSTSSGKSQMETCKWGCT